MTTKSTTQTLTADLAAARTTLADTVSTWTTKQERLEAAQAVATLTALDATLTRERDAQTAADQAAARRHAYSMSQAGDARGWSPEDGADAADAAEDAHWRAIASHGDSGFSTYDD